jgi:hypothetical protein
MIVQLHYLQHDLTCRSTSATASGDRKALLSTESHTSLWLMMVPDASTCTRQHKQTGVTLATPHENVGTDTKHNVILQSCCSAVVLCRKQLYGCSTGNTVLAAQHHQPHHHLVE